MKGCKTVGDVLSSEIVTQALQEIEVSSMGELVKKKEGELETKKIRRNFVSKLITLYKNSYQNVIDDNEIIQGLSVLFYLFSQENVFEDMSLDEIPDCYKKIAEETKIGVYHLLHSDISQEYPYLKGIYKALKRRFEITDTIGSYKKSQGENVVNNTRWEQVKHNIETHSNQAGFDSKIIKSLYKPIHAVSCWRQEQIYATTDSIDLGALRAEIDEIDIVLVEEVIIYLRKNQKDIQKSQEIISKLIESFRK